MFGRGLRFPFWWWFGLVGGDVASVGIAPVASPPSITQWVRCSAAAAGGATSVSVDVLNATIPSGTRLSFSGGTTATLTAAAIAGASTLSVSALSAGIAEGETAAGSVNVTYMPKVLVVMPTPNLVDGRPQ